MRRAPVVLTATAAGTAALLAFHPSRPATTIATAASKAVAGGRTYTGDVEANQYGNVQVRITVRNGKVVDVTALQVPADDPRSQQINAYAAPLLRTEALTAQSAQIDAVSGATYTSTGYQASLASALSRAGL